MPSKKSARDPIRGRRGARRLLVQALYQWCMAGTNGEDLNQEFLTDRAPQGIDQVYFKEVLAACMQNALDAESLISRYTTRSIGELSVVERAILILATVELDVRREIPGPVIINEAIELDRVFGAAEGTRFVNAVLDRVRSELRPSEAAPVRGPQGQ